MKKIQWGILSTATIAMEQVIPAIQIGQYGEILSIGSRSGEKARNAALEFNIPNWYDSYDGVLTDPQVEAVYIPLPNHLHVEWAIKAIRAGKHVLVEKPVSLNVEEARQLHYESKKHPSIQVMEAYMYKFHPQWIRVKSLIGEGTIGKLGMIQSSFSFRDDNPDSIVNHKEYGGGSLMDVGCYPVSISRFLYDAEPLRVMASLEYHPEFDVDIHASGIMEFEQGRSVFFSSIQLMEHQSVKLFGTKGMIEMDLPFNPPNNQSARITLTRESEKVEMGFEPCNQYQLQLDAFSLSVLNNEQSPFSLEDSVNNMRTLEAIQESGQIGYPVFLR